MRKQLIAATMAATLATGFALATGIITTATAASQGDGNSNAVRRYHVSPSGSHTAVRTRNPAKIRDSRSAGPGSYNDDAGRSGHGSSDHGSMGPGITFGTGDYGCSPTDKAYIGGFCGDYVPY